MHKKYKGMQEPLRRKAKGEMHSTLTLCNSRFLKVSKQEFIELEPIFSYEQNQIINKILLDNCWKARIERKES